MTFQRQVYEVLYTQLKGFFSSFPTLSLLFTETVRFSLILIESETLGKRFRVPIPLTTKAPSAALTYLPLLFLVLKIWKASTSTILQQYPGP